MFSLAFVAGWLQGHWWGFVSRNYVVWPTFFHMNVFIALKGSHFWFYIWKIGSFIYFWSWKRGVFGSHIRTTPDIGSYSRGCFGRDVEFDCIGFLSSPIHLLRPVTPFCTLPLYLSCSVVVTVNSFVQHGIIILSLFLSVYVCLSLSLSGCLSVCLSGYVNLFQQPWNYKPSIFWIFKTINCVHYDNAKM